MSIMSTNIKTERWFIVRRASREYLKYGKTVWRPVRSLQYPIMTIVELVAAAPPQ